MVVPLVAYTIQLVEVQQLRGAKNGVIFREYLHDMCKMAITGETHPHYTLLTPTYNYFSDADHITTY